MTGDRQKVGRRSRRTPLGVRVDRPDDLKHMRLHLEFNPQSFPAAHFKVLLKNDVDLLNTVRRFASRRNAKYGFRYAA